MPNIFIVTSGLKGILFACLAMCKRLEKQGNQVYLLAPENKSTESIVSREGISFFPLDGEGSQSSSRERHSKLGRMIRRYLRPASVRREKASLLHRHLQGFEQLIDQYHPSLVICDMECPEYVLYSLGRQLNVLMISHFLPVPAWPDIPIPNSFTRVNENSRLIIGMDWLWGRAALYLQNTGLRIRKQGTDKKTIILEFARKLGIGNQMIWSSTFLPGPVLLFNQIPLLHIMPEQFDFAHKLRENEMYIGPMVLEDRASDDRQVVESMEKTLQNKRGSKVIVCALSSLASVDPAFIHLLISAIGERENWMAFIGLGDRSELDNKAGLPSNIHLYQWLPVTSALPHADCAIITAGYNTINECMYYGVPMLAFSLNTTDQNGCIARILDHHLGLQGNFKNCSKRSLQTDIDTLLSDVEIHIATKRMMEHARTYQQEQIFEKIVDRHLS